MAWDPAPEFNNYDDVPIYRKRWFYVLCILLFIPAGLLIAFTGDVYVFSNGQVMKYPAASRIMIAVAWTAILAFNLMRAFR